MAWSSPGGTDGRAVVLLRLAAAALTVPALLAERGGGAGALALPWLAVGVTLTVPAAVHWLRRPDFGPAALARQASPVYLTVGAAWLVASRLGMEPVGIGEPIVELTAVHFHFAGFAAALLARPDLRRRLAGDAPLGGGRHAADDRLVTDRRPQHYDVPALDVGAMARIHGTLNAFGFSLAGLLGWVVRDHA